MITNVSIIALSVWFFVHTTAIAQQKSPQTNISGGLRKNSQSSIPPGAVTAPGGLRPPSGVAVAAAGGNGMMTVYSYGKNPNDDRWTCGSPAIGMATDFIVGSDKDRIVYSFGRPASGPVIGSWAINKYDRNPGRTDEYISFYYLDGTFTSGTFDTRPGGNFELRGITTSIGRFCTLSSTPNPSLYTIRIWGVCGEPRINFEVTERSSGTLISRITFSNDVSTFCANDYSSNIKTDLNIHRR
ncbi:MAG: hypothetical protein JWQ09_2160 [Segetibacter sp.]|nr:hypothetical protein [Segetibacter sp.]